MMPQDRTAHTPGTGSDNQGASTDRRLAAIAERTTEVESGAWQTRRAAGWAGDARQTSSEGSYTARIRPMVDNPFLTFLVGAGLGYAIARALHSSSGSYGGAVSADDEAISTLNHLIQISRDGEEGFRTCAEGVQDQHLKDVFTRAAARCTQGAAELEREVRALGGDPARGTTLSGSLHRRWVNIKSAITGMDETAVLGECERGEDVAKEAYRRAIDSDLPPRVRAIVERQYRGVRENHDRVRSLRNARR